MKKLLITLLVAGGINNPDASVGVLNPRIIKS